MRQGQTLAVLLVAVLIIVIVITLVWFSRQTPSGVSGTKGQTTYGAALQRAKEVECLNNLQQIRTAVQTYIATNGSNPPALSAVSLPGGVQPVCPVAKVPYTYDATTGTVKCPQHPKF
ncbi:MAG: hypothetical protein RRB24_07835 [Armatimonadota bacterium]|jgi:hypothetical protein|nr:hypothetical protein [Armatimonadota bacterium]MDT7972726.1 hypothetical protein [Armatimonadota bacterium]